VSRPAKPRTPPTRWEQVPLVLSVRAASAVVGVSPPTLQRAINEGALPVVQLGTRALITQDGLREFLAEQSQPRRPQE
jgi:excisionase family DNA binding protein